MVDEFESVVFGLRPGEVSPPFRSPFGFHVAILHEGTAAALRPLSDVRGQIVEMLQSHGTREAVDRFLDHLRGEADIRQIPARETEERVNAPVSVPRSGPI